MTRGLHLLNGLLLAALVGGSLFVYPELPERIPLHFGADGQADRWGDRTLLSWMALPLIGLATAALMTGVGIMLPRNPKWINMPDKDRLLQLPDYLQRWVIEGVAVTLQATTFVTLTMFAVIQYGSWLTAASGDGSSMVTTGVIIGLAVLPLVTVVMLVVMQRRMDAAWKQHQASLSDTVAS